MVAIDLLDDHWYYSFNYQFNLQYQYILINFFFKGLFIYFLYGIKNSKAKPDSKLMQSLNSEDIRKWGSLDDASNLPDNASTSSTY